MEIKEIADLIKTKIEVAKEMEGEYYNGTDFVFLLTKDGTLITIRMEFPDDEELEEIFGNSSEMIDVTEEVKRVVK